jgi:hypothetical protein
MRQRNSLVPFAGLGFAIVLLLSTVVFPGGATSNDPAAKIAAYYTHHSRGDIAADYASLLATPLLLAIFCAAAARVRGAVGAFLLVAAGIGAVFELAATAIELALAANVHSHAPATTTAALYQVASRMFSISTLGIGVAVATTAKTADRTRWLRRLGITTGVLLLIAGLAAAHPHGFLAPVLLPAWAFLLIWAVARSIAELRAGRAAPVTQVAPAA